MVTGSKYRKIARSKTLNIVTTTMCIIFRFIFEKSATYFAAGLKTSNRLNSLLPRAIVVSIIVNPADIAYSRYRYRIAHKDKAAGAHSFYEVITYNETTTSITNVAMKKTMKKLKRTDF